MIIISRLILAAVAISVFNVIVGMITCGGVFNWVYLIEPTNVWKPMDSAPPVFYFVGLFIVNIIFVAIFAMLNKAIPGKNKLVKGLAYGLGVWAVGMLPGMLSTYSFMTVADVVIVYWLIWGLVVVPLKGLIVASIYKN